MQRGSAVRQPRDDDDSSQSVVMRQSTSDWCLVTAVGGVWHPCCSSLFSHNEAVQTSSMCVIECKQLLLLVVGRLVEMLRGSGGCWS